MGTKAREGKDRTRIGSRHAKMQNGLQVVVKDSFPLTDRMVNQSLKGLLTELSLLKY